MPDYPLYLLVIVGTLLIYMLYILVCALIVIGTKVYSKYRNNRGT